MKQIIVKATMFLAVLSVSPRAMAQNWFTVDGITYNSLSETTCEVTSKDNYVGRYEGNVTIPEQVTYDGITRVVTAIGDGAFSACANVTGINIPNSVTSIGNYAFSGCTSLTGIDIPNSVTSIGKSTFERCFSLTNIDLPSSVTSIGDYAFYKCTGLMSVSIPNSITTIGEKTFYDCTSFTNIDIPNSVTTIGEETFYGCTSLTNIDIPNSVTSIGNYAFSRCTSLTSVDIPNSVTTMGRGAFDNCTSLTNVVIPNSVTIIEDYTFNGCTSLKSVSIPNSITNISSDAFSGCYLKELIIEDGEEDLKIDDRAFESYPVKKLYWGRNLSLVPFHGLTDVTIGSLVTDVSSINWRVNGSLESIRLLPTTPPTSRSFESQQYDDTKVTVPIGSLSAYLADDIWKNFWELKETNSIEDNDGENSDTIVIDGLAYRTHSETTCEVIPYYDDNGQRVPYEGDIVIPEHITYEGQVMTVTTIGKSAFSSCTNLRSIELPNTITEIGRRAFSGCANLLGINLPNSVTTIRSGAFSGCSGLTRLDIPDSVTAIKHNTFSGTGLMSVDIPSSVTAIGAYAFERCSYLLNVDIPNSVTKLEEGAFYNCSSLSDINISNSILSIKDNAFEYCSSLRTIDIPSSVITIGNNAFRDCKALTTVNFTSPSATTTICKMAFAHCSNLASINIPNSVTTIDESAFYDCPALTDVKLSNSLSSIGDWAFYDCSGITSISIPGSVTSMGAWAFENCPITELIIEDGEKTLDVDSDYITFYECPVENLYMGRHVSCPMNFKTLTDLTLSVTEIDEDVFSDCTNLENVTISNSVTTINLGAFGGCSNLKNLVFEDGKEYLEVHSGTFNGCPIEQLYLGRNLTCPESSAPSLNLTTLADVTIGSLVADVTAIDWTKNESLLSIKSFAATPPVSGKFTNPQYMNLKVSVPSGSLSSYKEDIVWRNFWNLQDDLPSAASIGEIPAPQSIKAADGRIIVENAQGRIEVYTLSGILMKSLPAQGGTTEIHLPQGVYIVKAGGETVKVIL